MTPACHRLMLRLLVLVTLGLIGCSLLIDPRDEHPRCERVDGTEVCPMGRHCVDGRCEPSCDAIEICGDNIDNDCDGTTDEVRDPDTCGDGIDNDCDGVTDETSDVDGDGFTWCGRTLSTSGGDVDCEPYNAAIYPGAPELCDGRDNDCDLTIDEAPSSGSLCEESEVCEGSCVPSGCTPGGRNPCASGERCDPEQRRCVPSRQCGARECAAGERCDTTNNACVENLLENGTTCGVDEDCRSQTCIRAASLRLASGSTNAHVCGQACCSDAECPEGQRCFASGSGARSCLPVAMIPTNAPAQCSTDDACKAPNICALNRAQSLSAPTFIPHSELITSTCRTPLAGSATLGQRCYYYGSCASRICVARPGITGQMCSTPCGSTQDCKTFGDIARRAGVTERAYCRYVTVSLDSSLRIPDYAPVCVIDRSGETGTGGTNAPCSRGSDCIDGGCVGATATQKGRCTPTCCSDAQCGRGEDGRTIHCRPFAFGNIYEMRCDLGMSP